MSINPYVTSFKDFKELQAALDALTAGSSINIPVAKCHAAADFVRYEPKVEKYQSVTVECVSQKMTREEAIEYIARTLHNCSVQKDTNAMQFYTFYKMPTSYDDYPFPRTFV